MTSANGKVYSQVIISKYARGELNKSKALLEAENKIPLTWSEFLLYLIGFDVEKVKAVHKANRYKRFQKSEVNNG